MLVSGVRSSCEASATNLRWRASVSSVSPRAALSSPSMSSKVCARSETSSFACGFGKRDVRVARARHLARGAREPGDRPHRALGHEQPAEEGEQRAADHAEGQEQPHAVHGRLDAALGLRVLHVADRLGDRPRQVEGPGARRAGHHELAGGHAKVADVGDPADRRAELDARVARPDRVRLQVSTTRTIASPAAKARSVSTSESLSWMPSVGGLLERDPVLELADVGAQVVVEAPDDALLGHRADDDREQAQDREGERGAQHRDLQLHRQAGPHGSLST